MNKVMTNEFVTVNLNHQDNCIGISETDIMHLEFLVTLEVWCKVMFNEFDQK